MPAEISIGTQPRLLLCANAYPSDSALYRNGFIHRRVKGYQHAGLQVEVFYHHEPVSEAYSYEFDGVEVMVGNEEALRQLVKSSAYDAYLIHFAEPGRVYPLLEEGGGVPLIIWIHGFEAEPWYRRWFNFIHSSESIRAALEKKETYYGPQLQFLRELAESRTDDITFVNVSKWFQTFIVEPAIGLEMPNSVVIPNLIDGAVFEYRKKDPLARKRILSLRPFASYKYANDLSAEAIIELSKRPFFSDLDFTICGEGALFDEITAPLQRFSNVTLLNRFFTQQEIAELHSSHGVFLSPTRFDSQGVSMGEAASSGLVVISTETAAVPEFFTDHEDALLVTPESPLAIADAIEELYFDAELFGRLSETGAARMQRQCGFDATIQQEIDLIIEKVRGSF